MEEKPASFYLGKEYDVEQRKVLPTRVTYDARDLTTHAVCLGMTGSGKTGLCINLLEEAALDGIPAIIIDPKGDITNLLLTFPELRPADFEPWVNPDDARRQGLSVQEYATQAAQSWAQGLADWEQGADRIQALREAAEALVFTPGSDAGLPVNILHTLKAPSLSWTDEEEALREKVQATVSALLRLVGIAADPVKSREHILLANLFEHAWRSGEDLDLAKLILWIQEPPLRKLGVFDVDAFFPRKDRTELAVAINSIIAAPSFENWLQGQPLDIDGILHRHDGKPRLAIFYLAHLSDAERMFFVTLLLAQVEAWMCKLPGTTSLRCIIHFDELYGYFPPHPATPPSKLPLLRLLKQARAYGVGLVLTTQNPIDLDYKGLGNAGTWFIGKLQTDRDKMRLLEGLEGMGGAINASSARSYFDRLISSLEKRVFILHNVHSERPIVFMTRWTMSYLRGPLTKNQIRLLMEPHRAQLAPGPGAQEHAEVGVPSFTEAPAAVGTEAELSPTVTEAGQPKPIAPDSAAYAGPPLLHPDIKQYFLPADAPLEWAIRQEEKKRGALVHAASTEKVYRPFILAWATVHFEDAQRQVRHSEEHCYLVSAAQDLTWVNWAEGRAVLDKDDLLPAPLPDAHFAEAPDILADIKELKRLEKDLANFLYRESRLVLFHNTALGLFSRVGEPEGRFVQRCQELARQWQKDEEDRLRERFEQRLARLEDRSRREERELEGDQIEYEGRKREERLTLGESLLGLFTGRRHLRTFSEVSRRRRLASQARAEVKESEEVLGELDTEMEALRRDWETELRELERRAGDLPRQMQRVHIRPRRADIDIALFGVAWVPFWSISYRDALGAAQSLLLPAYRGQRQQTVYPHHPD